MNDRTLWAAAVTSHWALDIPLTAIAIERYGAREANPIADSAIQSLGTVPGLVSLHAVVFVTVAGIWWWGRATPETARWSWVVPAIVALVGFAAAGHNLARFITHFGGVPGI